MPTLLVGKVLPDWERSQRSDIPEFWCLVIQAAVVYALETSTACVRNRSAIYTG